MPSFTTETSIKLAHTIIGAGTLGRRIALMWLTQGRKVHLFDSDAKALKSAVQYISRTLPSVLQDVIHNGKEGEIKTFTDRQAALQSSWLVTEAVPENLHLKIELLGDLDFILPEYVIIATNSSSYTSTELIEKVKHRHRIVSTHYYLPPKSLPVEIMPNQWTDPAIVPLLIQETGKHGLIPYEVKKESVGLIANRIWAAVKRECLFVVAQGIAEPAQIDSLLQTALGFRAPPFASMDSVGLDVVRDIERHYQQVRTGLPIEVLALLDKFVEQGRLGEKSGEGFYKHPTGKPHTEDHLIFLDIVKGEILAMTTNGKQEKKLLTGLSTMPDGIQIDRNGVLYFTNMGSSPTLNDGSISRIKPSASLHNDVLGASVEPKALEPEMIVTLGETHTPKQIHLDEKNGKLYWCDREGGRIQRCNLDGTSLKTIYDSAPGEKRPLLDATLWCVGVCVDASRQLLYWTQKGPSKGYQGRLLRLDLSTVELSSPFRHESVQVILEHLPEPIDLCVDEERQLLFWTDRGDPPFGNTLNCINLLGDLDPNGSPKGPSKDHIIANHFHEAIGLALDTKRQMVYVADLLGSIYKISYDGKSKVTLISDRGNFSGIAFSPGADVVD